MKENTTEELKQQLPAVDGAFLAPFTLRDPPSLLPASGNARVWRSYRACRQHAAGPGGRSPLGLEARLLGRSGIFAVVSRSVGSTAGNVSGLASRRSPRSNAGRIAFILP